jgi:hypothetical protein
MTDEIDWTLFETKNNPKKSLITSGKINGLGKSLSRVRLYLHNIVS